MKIISLLYEKYRYRSCLCGESEEREKAVIPKALSYLIYKVKKGEYGNLPYSPLNILLFLINIILLVLCM